MKKIILLALSVVFTTITFGQEIPQLKLTPDGVEPIVVEVEGMSASEIYQKALDWVKESYKNPEEVLKAKFKGQKIRLNGYKSSAWWHKSVGYTHYMNMDYTLEISFKDGRYRFDYIIGQFYLDGGQKTLYSYDAFYRKKDGSVKRSYTDAVPSLEKTMNDLSLSFYNYVSGVALDTDDDW
ncbi:DUF4468 domain-containing protein [Oceanihabitans sediminis]|uniref:DUF4468 domain-containing protein n=1 Tax=Oceanihabitans sediminis TaxID=1812012 RepID=A0A368P6E3_9FLAO|nr:DUF4468 domain-containing protein [Oceanihabitans sediminis]MDX1278381.1 DUF4468 domain-containing protein [Oceanihabitans sediminis]RBP34321.1 uncharacterized protein with TBP-like fold DUF4468 [Oceanihabitans sediminis]RCU58003.1 DUF4468 domain-containing protein [Oceanihabitans sediminis]